MTKFTRPESAKTTAPPMSVRPETPCCALMVLMAALFCSELPLFESELAAAVCQSISSVLQPAPESLLMSNLLTMARSESPPASLLPLGLSQLHFWPLIFEWALGPGWRMS
ncbi:MAG: hypothetical protein LKG12_03095 [Bifidobacterium tibiigranuli]|nr:hypothetical protein [Bifidobacterium tibiigranuli]